MSAGAMPVTEWSGRRLHFVGLGGAGMSGLALIAHELGADVTGSDRADSPYLVPLRGVGIDARIGHDAANVPAGDDVELVVSTAIGEDNPERAAGRARGLPEIHRGALLGELSHLRRTIAIAGTHGKTTTASMTTHALMRLGWEPSYVIGGALRSTGANAGWGAGAWLVVEADESDRSFLRLAPEVAVVTNVELDHHTTYASHVELEHAFGEFLRNGLRVVVADTREAEAFLDREQIVEAAFFGASDVVLDAGGARFGWAGQEVVLSVPGAHNVANAAAALTACVIAGAEPAELAPALADFHGAGRRFERLGEIAGVLVVDDYAHHPTEVRAAILTARTLGRRRVVAAFQPHLYSRTQLLAREFGAALALADAICVLDVYPSRERGEDFPGVSGLLVAEAAADAARGRPVAWAADFDAAERLLRATLRTGDVCLVLGAGDVDALGRRLLDGDRGALAVAARPLG
ncbi:MAG: UDP-N-acetylmuramate--alanine ligase [Solirubrobacteraceae bacterium]|nr:UDP-N-acetylmuramate--alanine ligase [Solirubrobacteraceae bacterium]